MVLRGKKLRNLRRCLRKYSRRKGLLLLGLHIEIRGVVLLTLW